MTFSFSILRVNSGITLIYIYPNAGYFDFAYSHDEVFMDNIKCVSKDMLHRDVFQLDSPIFYLDLKNGVSTLMDFNSSALCGAIALKSFAKICVDLFLI